MTPHGPLAPSSVDEDAASRFGDPDKDVVRHLARMRVATLVVAALATACTGHATPEPSTDGEAGVEAGIEAGAAGAGREPGAATGTASRPVTLAFAGDVHFQLHLARLLDHPRAGLGPVDRVLSRADVTMVNLESAVTERGSLDPKERERAEDRYWYRTSPAALDLLGAAGVDVVTVANNHGADYGSVGLRDTLRAARSSPVAVVGVGTDRAEAFRPYRTTVHGTRIAFLAADASFRESRGSVWAAGRSTPGLAAAHAAWPAALLAAVRTAARRDDVVVVYLHWGEQGQRCPTEQQRLTAEALAEAGADAIVGSHAHVLLGSGWLGGTYVDYGLGNFVWYHDREPRTGVLRLRLEGGQVTSDSWTPARIHTWGRPFPLPGPDRAGAVARWRALRGCAGLSARPAAAPRHREYVASVRPIGPGLAVRMSTSHRPGCPLDLAHLRHLRLTYVGFDGRDHTGELVVAARHAHDVVGVFRRLFEARWPIRRMRLVDEYAADDARSMAADNTSAYNCRRVRGSRAWSAHAFGAAVDLDPRENPYVTDASAPRPPRRPGRGVILPGDLVVRAFADIGWEWGGTWSPPDYQHFTAQRAR